MIRSAALALAVLFLLGNLLSVARAQDGDNPLIEKHLALIVANQEYDMDGILKTGPADMPPTGYLKDLANPCRDAALFQQTLLNAHWQPEEITLAPCDQTAPQMRQLIADFREKVANSTNTLAIFYFSGHGAQFSDADTNHSFLFGVDAKIDLNAVAESLRNSPRNTSAIANEAVDLDELTGSLGYQTQNAVLIIVDACRNNPLYGQISELENAPSITPLGATRDFSGIVIAYSTPHGEFSGDGFEGHSIFTTALVQELQPAKNLDSSLNALRRAVDIAYRRAYPQRTTSQVPVVTGRFSADWCLTQCAPQLPTATRALTNTVPSSRNLSEDEVRHVVPEVNLATSALPAASHILLATMATVQSQETPTPQGPGFTTTIYDRAAGQQDFSVPVQSGMHFDVFWCDGGDGAVDRQKRAFDIASALGEEAFAIERAGLPFTDLHGFEIKQFITSVRLRRLTTNANSGLGFRYSDDVIVYDKNDANEAGWAKVISNLRDSDLNQDGRSVNTPRYMSIFVCRAPKPEQQSKTLIYLQVPNDNLKSAGHLLLKDLNRLVPTVKDDGGIETRSNGPLSTEVRFFTEEERDSAFATAKAVEQILGRPVKVQFMPRLANTSTPGHIEMWIGKNDSVLDKNALGAIHRKKDQKE